MQVIPALYEGGAERFVIDLSNYLASLPNVSVHLVVLFDLNEEMFMARDISPNVNVHTLGKKLGFDRRVLFRFKKLVDQIKPDVVNTHLAAFEYNLFNVLSSGKRIYFHTVHNDALKECASSNKRKIRKYFFSRKKVYPITISHESSASFKDLYNVTSDTIIYNGRAEVLPSVLFNRVKEEYENEYKITPNTKILLNVGSIHPQKNQIYLSKAVKQLIDEGKDIVLLIIGGKRSDATDVFEELTRLSEERVKMLGVKSNVQDYLMLSDAFCLPSNYEGMPISLIEAFSAKCVALCTPVGGINNMIDDAINGVLAKSPAIEDLKEMIERFLFLSDIELDSFKELSYQRFQQHYSISASGNSYYNLYTNTITNKV